MRGGRVIASTIILARSQDPWSFNGDDFKLLLFISKIIYNLQIIQDTKIIFAKFVAIYMLNEPAKFEQNALMVTKVIFRYKMHQLQTHFSQE